MRAGAALAIALLLLCDGYATTGPLAILNVIGAIAFAVIAADEDDDDGEYEDHDEDEVELEGEDHGLVEDIDLDEYEGAVA